MYSFNNIKNIIVSKPNITVSLQLKGYLKWLTFKVYKLNLMYFFQ